MRSAFGLILVLLSASVLSQEPGPPALPHAQLIADLGNEDFRLRERAHQQLRDAGPAAKAALEKAAEESADAEIRQRADALLRRLTAGPRIQAAIAQLGSAKWDEVREALFSLCDEMGEETGAGEAVRKASDGKSQTAQLARVLFRQWENWDRQQQQFIRSVSVQGRLSTQQHFTSFRQNVKRSIESMCKREFDQLHAKNKKELEKAPDDP